MRLPNFSASRPKAVPIFFVLIVIAAGQTLLAEDAVVGFTEPLRIIELAASETGSLSELNVKPGDRVTAQQVIGCLDQAVLKANAEMIQARIDSKAKARAAEIRWQRSERSYKQLLKLRDEGHGGSRELQIAESDLDLALTDIEAVKEELLQNRLDLRRLQAEIQRRTIVSPIDGIVTDVHRDVGEFVAVTEPNVVTIVDLSQLRIRFYPSTATAESLTKGQTVTVKFLHSSHTMQARIEFIAPVIDADSNTVQVDVLLPNKDENIRSGRRCVLVTERDPAGSVTAPSVAKSPSLNRSGVTR